MSGRAGLWGGAFWFAGAFAFGAAFLLLFRLIPLYFSAVEPRYLPPIAFTGDTLPIRNDGMGEGHFGASRSHNRTHDGIDIAAPVGDAVLAAKSGRVSLAGPKGGYGNFVEIRHPDGLTSRYAHLSEIRAAAGEWIRQGQIIGRTGKTGNARSRVIQPHLHFEIRRGGTALDPMDWFEKGGASS